MPDRKWDTECWVANPSLARTTIGWKATHDLVSGLGKTLQWLESEANL